MSDIFDYAVKRAGILRYKINRTEGGITLIETGKIPSAKNSIGIFVKKSSKHKGMIFGFMSRQSDMQWNQLPGSPAPKVGVYSMPYRYIRTIDEVEIALRMFAASP